MNFLIFQNPYEFFQLFLAFKKIMFVKKMEAIMVQKLVSSLQNTCVRYGIFDKKNPKLRLLFKINVFSKT